MSSVGKRWYAIQTYSGHENKVQKLIVRKIDDVGFSHFDSKSSNWIVMPDEKRGPTPVLVDVDGVRFYPWSTFGVRRLLRSMRDHRQYTPADSLALCQGYAPFTRMELEEQLSEPEEVEGTSHA